MSTSYLDEKTVFKAYKDSQSYMRGFLDPVDEQERIAKNQPHPGIAKAYPKVTDGTTSSIIQKTPRRIVQQIPTGRVHSDTNDWLSIVAGFIYTERIIPNANEQNAFIDKCWRMIKNSMTFGASHSLTTFIHRGDYIGPDLSVPYIKNVKFEAGKVSDIDSNCIFVDAWYQEADIDGIIRGEKSRIKKVKERQKAQKEAGEDVEADYESTWDLKVLEEIKTQISAKSDDEKQNSDGKNKNNDDSHKSGVKLVHALQRGVGSICYTIHPKTDQIARRKKNKDPRGDIPEQTLYFESDGINPLGRGIVEQVGSLQNLMDAEMQMYQFNRALMLAPPMIKKGNWNKTQAKLLPNVLIDLGSDPNNMLDTLKIDTTAIANFPNNYGLMKSQLLNLTASPDTSISAEVGNPSFSKTDSGVKQQAQNVSVDDNYIRKQFESWFERWSECAINMYFAERTGKEELQLDKETAMKLRTLIDQGKLEEGFVSDDDKIVIDYDTATEVLKFQVDASTSNMKNDQQQLEALDGLLARYEKSPVLQQAVPQDKVVNVWNRIVAASGVENPEELAVSDEEVQEMQMEQEQAMMAEQQALEQAQASPEMPEMPEMQPQMPEQDFDAQEQEILAQLQQLDAEEQPEEPVELSEEDRAFAIALQDMGYSDDVIMQAFAMEEAGMSEEEIMEVMVGANG